MAVDMKDTLERIKTEWEAIGLKCECPKGSWCSICEITFLLDEALPLEEPGFTDDEWKYGEAYKPIR